MSDNLKCEEHSLIMKNLSPSNIVSFIFSVLVMEIVMWIFYYPSMPELLILISLGFSFILAAITFILIKYLVFDENINIKIRINIPAFTLKMQWYFAIETILFLLCLFIIPTMSDRLFVQWQEIPFLNWIRLIIVLLFLIYFPGHYLLIFIDNKCELNILENTFISCILSWFLISLFGFIVIIFGLSINDFTLQLSILLSLGSLFLISLIKKKNKTYQIEKNIHNFSLRLTYEKLLLFLILSFITLMIYSVQSIYGIYTGDEYGHFGWSLLFQREFPVIRGWFTTYPYWIHLFMSILMNLSGFPQINTFIVIHFFCLMPIISFYLMVSTLFKKERKIIAISTLIYSLFGGFGGLYALFLKSNVMPTTDTSLLSLLNFAEDKTTSILALVNNFPFTLILTQMVATTCFIGLIYLIFKTWKSNFLSYLLIFCFFTLSYLAHIFEIVIFIPIYALSLLVQQHESLNHFRKQAFSMLLSMLTIALIDYVAPGKIYTIDPWGHLLSGLTFLIPLFILFITIIISYLREMNTRPFIFNSLKLFQELTVVIVLLVFYFFGLGCIIYLHVFPMISQRVVQGPIPFYLFPEMFGLAGFFALLSILYYLIFKPRENRDRIIEFVILFASFILLIIFVFQLPTFSELVNSYPTIRLTQFLWYPVSILSAYFIVKLCFAQKLRNHLPSYKMFFSGALIVILLLSGTSSRLFLTEYYTLVPRNTHLDYGSYEFLRQHCEVNESILVLSDWQGYDLAHNTGIQSNHIFSLSVWSTILETKSPETLYYFLWQYNIRFLYVTPADNNLINNLVSGGSYLFGHLTQYLPIIYSNEAKIYNIPALSPPTEYSNLGLFLTTFPARATGSESKSISYVFDAVAVSLNNYTLCDENDYSMLNEMKTIILFDRTNVKLDKILEWVRGGGKAIVFNVFGLGSIADFLSISASNQTFDADSILGANESITGFNVNVTRYNLSPDVTIISQYVKNGTTISPFAVVKEIDKGEIVYSNIEPIIQVLKNSKHSEKAKIIFSKLGGLLSLIDNNLPKIRYKTDVLFPSVGLAYGKSINFVGNLRIYSKYLQLSSTSTLYADSIFVDNLKIEDVLIKDIDVNGSLISTMIVKEGKIKNGYGKYAFMDMYPSYNWTINLQHGSSAHLIIATKNDTKSIVANDFIRISINPNYNEHVSMLIKCQRFDILGNITFINFYNFWPFNIPSPEGSFSSGSNLLISGNTTFHPLFFDGEKFLISKLDSTGKIEVETLKFSSLEDLIQIDWRNILFSPEHFFLLLMFFNFYIIKKRRINI